MCYQNVSYDVYCNATAVLKVGPVYKQGQIYYPQVYAKGSTYNDAESQHNMSSNSEDEEFFEI